MKLTCEIIANSDVEHLQQIYAGFSQLHDQGAIKLKQTIPAEYLRNKNEAGRWIDYRFFNARVIVNEKIRVCYDTHDWNRIDEEVLSGVDFYFKRSYDENYLGRLKEKSKVFPLGLNYQVTNDRRDFFRLKRAAFYTGKDKIKLILKALRIDNFLPGAETERLDRMHSPPDLSLEPKILFMARAWDTEAIPDSSQKEIVENVNETRAESIRVLRREFGSRFFGGLMRDRFSEKYYPDVLLADNSLANKRAYLATLREFPICVATKGLNDSNGWKLAEYVAFSKAIITEPPQFAVPGDFAAGKNYLEFTDSESLLKAAGRFFDDGNLRETTMKNNHRYYEKFVRPDALVMNTLKIAAG